jgi:hypothetical protein
MNAFITDLKRGAFLGIRIALTAYAVLIAAFSIFGCVMLPDMLDVIWGRKS